MNTHRIHFSGCLVLLLLFSSCGVQRVRAGAHQVNEKKSDHLHSSHIETGLASYYADKYELRKTASGQLYRHDRKTAAHKTLPFGSRVRVTNTDTGKSVIVTINDRGPYGRGRVIDLSKSAFREIGNVSSGLLRVSVELLK